MGSFGGHRVEGLTENLEIVEKGRSSCGRDGGEYFLHASLVAGDDFLPEAFAFCGEDEDGLAAVFGVLMALDEAIADHAVKDGGSAGFADEKEVDEGGLLEAALAMREEIENVELGGGEAVRLEEGVAAALEKALDEKEANKKIVGLGRHGN
jgi:hypothetical protein